MTLLLSTLAVLFVWETVLSVVPWTIPALLQSVLVYGTALAFVWPDWRLALAVCGAVWLLHGIVRQREAPTQMIRRPRRTGVPNLP